MKYNPDRPFILVWLPYEFQIQRHPSEDAHTRIWLVTVLGTLRA